MTEPPLGYGWQVGGNSADRLMTRSHHVVRDLARAIRDLFSTDRDLDSRRPRPRRHAHVLEWVERALHSGRADRHDNRLIFVHRDGYADHAPLSVVGEMVFEHLGRLGILRPIRVWNNFDPPYVGSYDRPVRRMEDDWSSVDLDHVELATWEAAGCLALDVDP